MVNKMFPSKIANKTRKRTQPSFFLSIRLGSGKPEIRISKSGLRPLEGYKLRLDLLFLISVQILPEFKRIE